MSTAAAPRPLARIISGELGGAQERHVGAARPRDVGNLRVLPILNSARCLVSYATRDQTVSEGAEILDA